LQPQLPAGIMMHRKKMASASVEGLVQVLQTLDTKAIHWP
jgi:ABC-type proline/glycine betaine transport system permease subunit